MKVTAASADCKKRLYSEFVKTCFLLVSCVIHSKGPVFQKSPKLSWGRHLFCLLTSDWAVVLRRTWGAEG